jgi:hypothetical protein
MEPAWWFEAPALAVELKRRSLEGRELVEEELRMTFIRNLILRTQWGQRLYSWASQDDAEDDIYGI